MDTVQVETPKGFDFRATLLSHGWLELAPFSHDERFSILRRTHVLETGEVVDLEFSDSEQGCICVQVRGYDQPLPFATREEIAQLTRKIFNLDIDLRPFYQLLEGEERYAWVQPHGAGRLLRSPSVWEDLAKTLLTTNTTWAMTKQMVKRLTQLGPEGRFGHAFPPPDTVASLSPDTFADLVRAGYRSSYLYDLATQISTGSIDPEAWSRHDAGSADLHEEIRRLKGFGPYAAGAVMKLLGRFEFLAVDSSVRSMFAREFSGGSPVNDKAIHRHYDRFGAWRGLVTWMDLMHDWIIARGADPMRP